MQNNFHVEFNTYLTTILLFAQLMQAINFIRFRIELRENTKLTKSISFYLETKKDKNDG